MKYVFAAIFTPEENDMYSVNFPDIENCYTCGNDLSDAIHMAQDVLNLTLYDMELEQKPIPEPRRKQDILIRGNQFINIIAADTETYRKILGAEKVA